MTMRMALARPGAGIDALEFREAPVPEPGPGEALVRLKAATFNFRDLLFIKGVLPFAKGPQYVPLSCAAGEVIAVGQGVTRVKPGDRVNPLFHQNLEPGASGSADMLGGSVDGWRAPTRRPGRCPRPGCPAAGRSGARGSACAMWRLRDVPAGPRPWCPIRYGR